MRPHTLVPDGTSLLRRRVGGTSRAKTVRRGKARGRNEPCRVGARKAGFDPPPPVKHKAFLCDDSASRRGTSWPKRAKRTHKNSLCGTGAFRASVAFVPPPFQKRMRSEGGTTGGSLEKRTGVPQEPEPVFVSVWRRFQRPDRGEAQRSERGQRLFLTG